MRAWKVKSSSKKAKCPDTFKLKSKNDHSWVIWGSPINTFCTTDQQTGFFQGGQTTLLVLHLVTEIACVCFFWCFSCILSFKENLRGTCSKSKTKKHSTVFSFVLETCVRGVVKEKVPRSNKCSNIQNQTSATGESLSVEGVALKVVASPSP